MGKKNKQTKKGKQIQKNAEKIQKKNTNKKQKTRRGVRKPTGWRERERGREELQSNAAAIQDPRGYRDNKHQQQL